MNPNFRTAVSFGARFGEGGVGTGGWKIVAGLREIVPLKQVLCTGLGPNVDIAGAQLTPLRIPLVNTLARWTPLRFWEGGLLSYQNNVFDLLASRALQPCDLFWGWADQALFTLRRAKRWGAQTILHAPNAHIRTMGRLLREEYRRFGLRATPVTALQRWKTEREYAEADWVRAQSTFVRDTLVAEGVPAKKVALLHPWADLEQFRPAPKEDRVFRILTVGLLSLLKGVQYLLPAFQQLNLPQAELLLQGGIPNRFMKKFLALYLALPSIRQQSGPSADVYPQCSVCVMASIEDGFSHVVPEAMACARPVIVTENVGAKDLVRDGVDGFIVPVRNVEALKEKILFFYEHPQAAEEMGRNAYERVREFGLEYHVEKLRRILASMQEV